MLLADAAADFLTAFFRVVFFAALFAAVFFAGFFLALALVFVDFLAVAFFAAAFFVTFAMGVHPFKMPSELDCETSSYFKQRAPRTPCRDECIGSIGTSA